MDYSLIKSLYKKHVTKREKYCIFSVILWGLLSYAYLFMNIVNNHDNISVTPSGYGTGITIGRWLLTILGDFTKNIWGNYNVPLFIGIIAIILIGLSCVFVIKALDIKNIYLCSLIGGITVVFPAINNAMFYTYTIGYYALALLLVASGAYFTTRYKFFGVILGAIFLAFSLGIYQSYLPFFISIFLIILIKMCFQDQYSFKDVFLKGLKFALTIVLGYILYRILLSICLACYDTQLSSFRGVDNMGVLDIETVINDLKTAYKSMYYVTKTDYVYLSGTKVVQLSYLLAYVITGITIIVILLTKKFSKASGLKLSLCAIILFLFPVSVNFIVIMATSSGARTRMQLGFVCIFYLLAVLVDFLCESDILRVKFDPKRTNIIKNTFFYPTIIVLLLCTTNYMYQNNVSYRASHYANMQTVNYFETLFTRVTSVQGYDDEYDIKFIGSNITDEAFTSPTWNVPFHGEEGAFSINMYSRNRLIYNYLGYRYSTINVDSDQYNEYRDEIEQMSIYPDDGSIAIVDDYIFIRLE